MLRHLTAVLAVTVAAMAAVAAWGATAADAAVTCFSANGLISIDLKGHHDGVRLDVEGRSIVVKPTSFGGEGAALNCGAPTVDNTETIELVDHSDDPLRPGPYDGDSHIQIHDAKHFAPGKTLEQNNAAFSEIEFVINPMNGEADSVQVTNDDDTPDNFRMGALGLDFNAGAGDPAPDAEIALPSAMDTWIFEFGNGGDVFSAQGGPGVGGPYSDSGRLSVHGDDGNDTLEGSDRAAGDFVAGYAGQDTLRGFAGDDVLRPGLGDDAVDGGAGADEVTYESAKTPVSVDLAQTGPQDTGEGTDTIAGAENLRGSIQADTLSGDAGANALNGSVGDDTLAGRGGADALDGSVGADTVTYAGSPAAVNVDLTAGTATGEGTDTLKELENVTGSPFADTLSGNALPNALTGLGGEDTLVGQAGADVVAARDGSADNIACGAETDAVTADRRSLDRIAADCEVADVLPEPAAPDAGGNAGDAGGGGEAAGAGDGGPAGGPGAAAIGLTLTGARTQRVLQQKGVLVGVRCTGAACRAVAGAAGKAGRVRIAKEKAARVRADATKQLKLRLGRTQLAALRAALDAGRRPVLKVTVRATHADGTTTTETLKVKVAR